MTHDTKHHGSFYRLDRYGSDADSDDTTASDTPTDGKQWIELCTTADFKDKPTKSVVLANGDAFVVYKVLLRNKISTYACLCGFSSNVLLASHSTNDVSLFRHRQVKTSTAVRQTAPHISFPCRMQR